MKPCERCGAPPKGEYGLHDYCRHCSRDLCAECMRDGTCPDSPTRKHEPSDDDVAAFADNQGHTFCPGCWSADDEPEHTYRDGDAALSGLICDGCGEELAATA